MSNIQFDFSGRTVVTGAARGVGRAIAEQFVTSGATVYVVDADEAAVAVAREEFGADGIVADVSNTEDVNGLVARVLDREGRIDVVVNNAGILRDGLLWKMPDADWDDVLAVHVGGTFKLTRAVVPHFRERRTGRVINVTSYTGMNGNARHANYAAAKAGNIGCTKTAAKELARFGITVYAISPNAETRMIAAIPEERRAANAATIPLGRFTDPSEMSAAVAFLASDEASYITGTVLPVDGGISM